MGQHNRDGLSQIGVDVVRNSGILGVSGQTRWLGQHVIGTRRRLKCFHDGFCLHNASLSMGRPTEDIGMTFVFHTNMVIENQNPARANQIIADI